MRSSSLLEITQFVCCCVVLAGCFSVVVLKVFVFGGDEICGECFLVF